MYTVARTKDSILIKCGVLISRVSFTIIFMRVMFHYMCMSLAPPFPTGRPPWYDAQGQIMDAFVIGLSGGSASGKTTVARKVIESLRVPWVTLLSMDSFYKVLTKEQHEMAARNEYNFDHPGTLWLCTAHICD